MTRIFESIEQAKRFNERMEEKGPENELSEGMLSFAQMLVSGTSVRLSYLLQVSKVFPPGGRTVADMQEEIATARREFARFLEVMQTMRLGLYDVFLCRGILQPSMRSKRPRRTIARNAMRSRIPGKTISRNAMRSKRRRETIARNAMRSKRRRKTCARLGPSSRKLRDPTVQDPGGPGKRR